MVGGAAAIFLHADVGIAECEATFRHGNLSRGVCPVAGASECCIFLSVPAVSFSERYVCLHDLCASLSEQFQGTRALYKLPLAHRMLTDTICLTRK